MSDTRKKEIIMAALELAANKGLGNVSMNMIADKVGIKNRHYTIILHPKRSLLK